MAEARYVPAAGRRGLTALYDPCLRLTTRERAWRPWLVREALASDAAPVVVDVGCGTGTLAVALAEGGASVVGVDGDDDVLARAAAKAEAAGVTVELRRGLAQELPAADGAFDTAICSLVLHHLASPDKAAALAECRRVLRPDGRLLIADWGRAADPFQRAAFFGLQLLDGFAGTRDHAAGRLPALIEAAGFAPPRLARRLRTPFGTLELISAQAQGS